MNIVILSWTPRTSGTLRGHLSLRLLSGLLLREVSLHHRDGNWWLAMPARPMLQDGTALRDANNKVRYAPPVIGFAGPEIRSRSRPTTTRSSTCCRRLPGRPTTVLLGPNRQ